MKKRSVMFVCTGNICRSPLAHAVFEQLVSEQGFSDSLYIESSGTGAWHVGQKADPRMCRTAREHGVSITHLSRQLTSGDLCDFDVLLAMDRHNFRDIISLCRNDEERNKVRMFRDFDPQGPGDVPDPWYGESEGFHEVWKIVRRTCENLVNVLRSEINL